MEENARKKVDLLVNQFWKKGYLTVSRKYGTYLPEPGLVGRFNVDIIAKHKNDYAIGINLSTKDFSDNNLSEKLIYLATRHTKYTNKKVKLFVGVSASNYRQAKMLIDNFEEEVQKNISLFRIVDDSLPSIRRKRNRDSNVLFS